MKIRATTKTGSEYEINDAEDVQAWKRTKVAMNSSGIPDLELSGPYNIAADRVAIGYRLQLERHREGVSNDKYDPLIVTTGQVIKIELLD